MNNIAAPGKTKLLLIAPDFDYSNGVTRHLRSLLKLLSECDEFELHFITNRGDALSEIEKIRNIKFKMFPFSNNKFYLKSHINFFRYLTKYCKVNNINLIHTHHRYPEIISKLVAKRLNLKTVTTAHSLVRGLKSLSFKSDLIIAVSDSVRNHIIKNFNVAQSKVVKIYNCVLKSDYDSDISNPDDIIRELNISQKHFIIFFNGRIGKTKGIDLLLNAFKLLNRSYNNLILILVGVIESSTITNDLPQNVLLLNPEKDISKYYLISDLVILPSRSEPLGYVMLEAGLFNKPFIGAKVDGIAEFIEDGVEGLLFEPGNSDDLVKKILYILNHPDDAKRMAENLYEKVKKNNDCSKYFDDLNKIYNSLMTEK